VYASTIVVLANTDEPRTEEPKTEEPKTEEPRTDEANTETPRIVESPNIGTATVKELTNTSRAKSNNKLARLRSKPIPTHTYRLV
jgi:hypothetical protein